MCAQLPVDTSVITPVAPSMAGISGGASPLASPAVPGSPVPQVAPLPSQQLVSPPVSSSIPVVPELPPVEVMFEQLKNSGILINDITIKPPPNTSPLAHLQPGQLINSPTGPQPAYLAPAEPNPAAVIQLASTAPVVHHPTSQHVERYMQAQPRSFNFVTGIVLGLALMGLAFAAFMVYQRSLPTASGWTEGLSNGYDAVLEQLPFVERTDDNQTPEAVWYQ